MIKYTKKPMHVHQVHVKTALKVHQWVQIAFNAAVRQVVMASIAPIVQQ